MQYKAYLVEEKDGIYSGSVQTIDIPQIDEKHVLIKVNYSSLNYKDALAATGAKGVVKKYPFVPGIDVAGEVIESTSKEFAKGDKVIATGYKIGMSEFGGFGEIVHLPSDWVIHLPENLTYLKAMEYGTAGLTAAACVKKIVDEDIKNNLPVLISGVTGGVGSIAAKILNKLDFDIHGISGKIHETDLFKEIGLTKVIARDDFLSSPVKALDKGVYSAAVDTVGGTILAKMISIISNGGVVSCCGNVAGAMFTSSVFPFILRGIQLCGIDSAESPIELKKELWNLLSYDWAVDLSNQTKSVKIENIDLEIEKILSGNQAGRVIIEHGE